MYGHCIHFEDVYYYVAVILVFLTPIWAPRTYIALQYTTFHYPYHLSPLPMFLAYITLHYITIYLLVFFPLTFSFF